MGTAVEWIAAHERRRPVWNADGQENLAIGRAFAHGVVAVIGAIEIVFGIDGEPMRAGEHPLAPACDEITLAVEHDHRMDAPVEDVDAVLAVDCNGSHIGEFPPLRQLRPVFHHAVTMLARAESDRHVFLPDVFSVDGLDRSRTSLQYPPLR